MQTARITIAALSDDRHAQDLSNALIGVSGIARIDVDTSSHMLIVEYDPDHLYLGALRSFIERAGYPIEDGGANQ